MTTNRGPDGPDRRPPRPDALASEFDDFLGLADSDPKGRAAYEDRLQKSELLLAGASTRKQRRLSQARVADLMETTQSAVSDLEAGRVEPQLRTLQRYARAIGRKLAITFASPVAATLPESTADLLVKQCQELALSSLLTTLVRQSEERSRTMQALADNLSVPTLAKPLLSALQADGWTTSRGEGDAQVFTLVDGVAYLIGVTIRSNEITGVLMTLEGAVTADLTVPLPTTAPEDVVSACLDAIEHLHGRRGDKRVLGVGVSLAGVIDAESGRVDFAPALQGPADPWRGIELEKVLEAGLKRRMIRGLRVAVENDANAAAAWEYLQQGDDSVAVVLLSGVGVGAGFVAEGRIVHGGHSAAGEGGHIIVDPSGPPCAAGQAHAGCLETMASARGLLSGLGIPVTSPDEVDEGLDVLEDRLAQEEDAVAAVRAAGQALGDFVASLVLLMDPNRVVVCAHPRLVHASSSRTAAIFQEGLESAMAARSGDRLSFLPALRLEWTELSPEFSAVAAGAAALWHFLKRPLRWAPSLLTPTTTASVKNEFAVVLG